MHPAGAQAIIPVGFPQDDQQPRLSRADIPEPVGLSRIKEQTVARGQMIEPITNAIFDFALQTERKFLARVVVGITDPSPPWLQCH
jgi:hypothetical protein